MENLKITELLKAENAVSTTKKTNKCPILFVPPDDGYGYKVIIDGKAVPEGKSAESVYDEKLCELTGTDNKELAKDVFKTAAYAICGYKEHYEKNNIVLQSLSEQKPRDVHEARLCLQATALYSQGMDYLERARNVLFDDTMAKDHWHALFMKTATKLLDLHAKTVAELTRYKQNGEQRIVVQHVNVENGGKAIVGNVYNEGGGGC